VFCTNSACYNYNGFKNLYLNDIHSKSLCSIAI
jgi:hypothetical protein